MVDSLETLPDGTIIVKVGGKTYRGLPPEKMREILQVGAERDAYKQEAESLRETFEQYKEKVKQERENTQKVFSLRLENEKKESLFWKQEFEKEKELRTKYSERLQKCSGKFLGIRLCWYD